MTDIERIKKEAAHRRDEWVDLFNDENMVKDLRSRVLSTINEREKMAEPNARSRSYPSCEREVDEIMENLRLIHCVLPTYYNRDSGAFTFMPTLNSERVL